MNQSVDAETGIGYSQIICRNLKLFVNALYQFQQQLDDTL